MLKRKLDEDDGILLDDIATKPAQTRTSNTPTETYRLCTQEKHVYITEYISDFPGFSGILKQRFSDFHVNEIDTEKNVVYLTDKTVPEFSSFRPKCLQVIGDCQGISKEQWDSLLEMASNNDKNNKIKIEVTKMEKEARTKIHKSIRDTFNDKFVSCTVEEGDRKYIVIGMDRKIDSNRNSWPKEVPQYLHFVLYKVNMDTSTVFGQLAYKLRTKTNMINHAGTKDRRGHTTQRVCIRRISTDCFKRFNIRNVYFGNFQYRDSYLNLGDLYGNRFRIVLRNVDVEDEELEKIMKSLETRGFINYFGLQRFGTSVESPTYEIGRCLVCKRWKQAIELILKPRINDKEDLAQARLVYRDSRNSKEALKLISKYNFESIEAKILQTLASNGETAYVNALQMIPRNVLQLYMHSYQSLIWNRIVSRRIKTFGYCPLVGDLITIDEKAAIIDVILLSNDDATTDESEQESQMQDLYNCVRPITEKEVHNVKMEDIVYPLPGYKVRFPDNEIAQWYKEVLSEDNLTSDQLKQNERLFSLPGGYRKMIGLPEDLKWKLMRYNDPSADLIQSDVQTSLTTPPIVEELLDGVYKALLMEFSVPACVYATMAIREITKQDTSASYQIELNSQTIGK